MATYKAPGVYIEEISGLTPSIASVSTAIPAFVGYTQKAQHTQPADLVLVPRRISSMLEYEELFGIALPEEIEIFIDTSQPSTIHTAANVKSVMTYLMYYSLQLYFANGGGPCYIISAGLFKNTNDIDRADLEAGLAAIKAIDEITLIVFPDAINFPAADQYYGLHKQALQQCADLLDRFTIMDVWVDHFGGADNIRALRSADLGDRSILQYGAVYYPRLITTVDYVYDETTVIVTSMTNPSLNGTLAELKSKSNTYYEAARDQIKATPMILPVSAAVAGIYAAMDQTRGVWKAPANVNLKNVTRPVLLLNKAEQDELNVDPVTGKSINVVRKFPARGNAVIWGARTLAGNDNEWRYISVRRFFNMVEESVRKSTERFVFEPNDATTWARMKSLIINYLTLQWKAGALVGDTVKEAFFVQVGLGDTMTANDILEGRMITVIGMAVIRPAEFITITFTHKMQES